MAEPVSYYSHGIVVGDVVYTSGQTAHDASGNVWDSSDEAGHIRSAFRNIAEVLQAGGVEFGDVVRMTIFLRHSEHIDTVWEVASEFLGDHRPAVTLATVPGLVDPEYLVEVDAIAVK